jgi:hypothetical protein
MNVCMHVCVYACMCVCMYVALSCMRVCVYTSMHALSCMCVCIYACCAFVERAVKQMVVKQGNLVRYCELWESCWGCLGGCVGDVWLGMYVSFAMFL